MFIAPLQTRKFRGRNNDFESTFQQVASSFATFLDKQSEEKLPQIISSQQVESKLKYIQMYEELDKALDNVNFLDAVKLLTNTTESATSKFQKKNELNNISVLHLKKTRVHSLPESLIVNLVMQGSEM